MNWRKISLYQVAIDVTCATVMGIPSLWQVRQKRRRLASQALRCRICGKRFTRIPKAHWELYELAEKLVDLEDYFRRWRFNHVTTVERIIGFKRGTGRHLWCGLFA